MTLIFFFSLARKRIQPLRIVTGTGNHSDHGRARLLPSIQSLLKKGGWQYEVPNPGCFIVRGVSS